MIAMALSCSPDIRIADEPSTALDVTTQAQIMELMLELQEQTQMAIILITHDMGVIASCFKSVACVNQRLFYHEGSTIPEGMLDMAYLCPVEVVAHGVPHRVLPEHMDRDDA